jgi:hypothetical protein
VSAIPAGQAESSTGRSKEPSFCKPEITSPLQKTAKKDLAGTLKKP